jgi:hypothetical protein
MKPFIHLFVLLLMSWSTTAQAQVDYKSLTAIRDRFPPAGWSVVKRFDYSKWQVVDVTNASQVGAANAIKPNDDSVDITPKLLAIVASSTKARVLRFPAGTYYLKSHLSIRQSNILIQGDGRDKTKIVIAAPASANAEFEFSGFGHGSEAEEVDVTTLPQRGTRTLDVADASTLNVGNVIYVLDKSRSFFNGIYSYAQYAVITAKSGNRLTLDAPLGLTFGGDPKVRKANMISNVGMINASIRRDRAASTDAPHNLQFIFARNVFVGGVESSFVEQGGIVFSYCLDAIAAGNFVHDAWNYGRGGQGYGIVLTLTTRGRVFNNKVWNMRHHFLAARGTNHSVFAYNSAEANFNGTTGDLILHGFTPHNNLFEGNMGAVLIFDGRSEKNGKETQGLWNTAFRNNLTRYPNKYAEVESPRETGNFPHERPTIIGNVLDEIIFRRGSDTVDRWVGANRIKGVDTLGSAGTTWVFPPSLYLREKPSFMSATTPWPMFGPNAAGGSYGKDNNLPAFDRSRN